MVSKVDLLILGLLMDRPMHGYEISQVISSDEMRGWLSVSLTSIYYALNKLRKSGSIVETVHKSETSPERTVYHITDEGRQSFFALMEKSLGSTERPYFDFDLGINFISRLPQSSVTRLLAKRRRFLQEWSRDLEAGLKDSPSLSAGSPSRAIREHSEAFVRTELEWLDHFADELGMQMDERHRGVAGGGHLMTLSGDLHSMHLPDVLKFMAAGELTGTLTLRRDETMHTLAFEEGHPRRAALRQSGEPVSDPEEVLQALRLIFRWDSGYVTFEQGRTMAEEGIPVSCSVDQLILEGARQVDNWGTIQRLVPSVSAVFERRSGERARSLPLIDAERLVVEAIDGTADVAAIAAVTGLSMLEASRILYSLSVLGSVRTVDLEKVRMRRSFRYLAESLILAVAALAGVRAADACEQAVNAAYRPGDIRIARGKVADESDPDWEPQKAARSYADFLRTLTDVAAERLGRSFVQQSVERIVRQATPDLQETISRYGFARGAEGAAEG